MSTNYKKIHSWSFDYIFPRAFEAVIFAKFGGQTECIQLGPLSYVNTSC